MVVAKREQRVRERRAQVIAGARACFREKGFHGANMAEVARAAGMSVGHVYHYFPSKDDLIGALVEDIYRRRVASIDAVKSGSNYLDDVIERLTAPASQEEYDDGVLTIAATAEAAVNPRVAELVRKGTDLLREQVREIYRRQSPEMTDAAADARIEIMSTFGDGLAMRRIAAAPVDRAALAGLYRRVIAAIDDNGASGNAD